MMYTQKKLIMKCHKPIEKFLNQKLFEENKNPSLKVQIVLYWDGL